MRESLRALAGPLFMLAMLLASLWLLHHELRDYHWREILASLAEISPTRICLASGLTVTSYLVLCGYDLLGIHYIGQRMSWPRIVLASFLGYAVGNNFGTLLGGSTVRLRLYTAWGLSAVEIIRLVLILSITFWIGLFTLSSVVFIADPFQIPAQLRLPFASTVPLGVVLGLVPLGYLALCGVRREPLRVRQWDFSPPSVGFALLQLLISALDLIVVAAVLYVLMPASLAVNYLHFLTIYLLALVAGLFSQVPGGLGVFEVVILIVLNPSEPPLVAGSLLAYRVIYYLIPLSVGLLLLSGNEIAVNRRRVGKIARVLGHGTRFLAPRVLAVTVFLAGTMLLFSGATPPAHGRLRLLREILPLPVIEVSHFFGSVVGLLLILLARGLQRRVVTAYYTATILLASGIAFSLLKGFDYEEAAILALMLCLFLPCRRHFYRKGALYDVRTSPGWLVGAGLVIACTAWLMVFSYKHIEYSNELWWQFAFEDSAPRSLRAMAGVALLTLGFAVSRLLRAKPKPPAAPTPDDLATVRQIVARCPSTEANLALLGDKYFLFNNQRTTFIMYGTEGRSWISMGDPVGEEEASRELIWDFRELCDEGGRWPVFYQVDEERVSMYVEMGLTLIKLGEEARVSLSEFGLEGGNRKGLRRTNRQLAEQGCTFELVEPPLEDALLSELRKISDNWLAEKKTAEKGFSLGFFQPDYLRHAPAALVRQHGQLIAFANVLRGAGNEELSLDLMRYQAASPASVMEYLFIQLMLWGKQQGYRWFNLGMAPLAGIDAQRLGPLWNRFAALAYRHGENFYNFQGLRQYKEKFDPIWTAKYLASPGGLALPVILTNVATLISGGLKELVKK